jgi:hypothetical protein
VIEGAARRRHRSSSARDRTIQKIGDQRHHPRGERKNRRAPIPFGHEKRERKHKKQANSRQRISHGFLPGSIDAT